MKTHKVLWLALIVSAVLSVSAQADNDKDNHKGNSGSHAAAAPARASAPTFHSASGSQFNGGRIIGPSQRFSSVGVGSMPNSAQLRAGAFRQQHINSNGGASLGQRQFTPEFRQQHINSGASFSQRQFSPETFNHGNNLARFENSRRLRTIQGDHFGQIQNDRENRLGEIQNHRGNGLGQFENRRAQDLGSIRNNRENHVGSIGNGNRGLAGANANNHLFARHDADWHRDWDRHSDHWWHGHRCRFVNNSWFIFDFGFFPGYGYPYDYYASDYNYADPYGYDPGVYEGADYYSQGEYQSSDQYTDSTVAAAQERLAGEGYYRGAIDGVLGPATHRAILRYQSDHGLRVSGYLTADTLQSLGLGRVAAY
jgi:hypothetical protein